MIIMNSVTTINMFGNPKMITNRQKLEIPINLLINAGSKMVDEVGKIPRAGQTNSIQRLYQMF